MQLTIPAIPERLREPLRRRGTAVVLALIIEALILLLFLSFVPALLTKEKRKLVTFGLEADTGDPDEAKTETKQKAKAKGGPSKPQPQVQPLPVPLTPPVPPEAKLPSNILWLSRRDYAASDIADKQGSAARSNDGDGSSSAGDSALAAGRGPHGEPLYAAEWYREPTNAQLSPYVPDRVRNRGGWGVIACRTVENYRVEDCQELDDSPRGSGYAGAVRQAAWQFRVRPPRVGGKPLIGSWVRILITYTVTRAPRDAGAPSEDQ